MRSPVPLPASHVSTWVRQNTSRFLHELRDFIRIPSVSGVKSRLQDVQHCGEWLASHLQQIGMTKVWLSGPPGKQIVMSELETRASRPWVLVYGHYDVQPEGAAADWRYPPFSGTVSHGAIWGRGASDNKGQLICQLKALEYLIRHRRLRINIRCSFEAEEEFGSHYFLQQVQQSPDKFRADLLLVSDTSMQTPERPTLMLGLRGHLALTLQLTGLQRALHSGAFGGAVLSPAQAIGDLLAKIHDRHGRILINGFYADVRPPDVSCPASKLARNSEENRLFYLSAGALEEWGDDRFTPIERTTVRPAIVIQSLQSGCVERTSSAIPVTARASLGIRIVPDQCPRKVLGCVKRFLESNCPPQVKLEIRTKSISAPVAVDASTPSIDTANRALAAAFGFPAVHRRSGGSIPPVAAIAANGTRQLVLMGYGLPTDRIHASNEHFRISQLQRGILSTAFFLENVHEAI